MKPFLLGTAFVAIATTNAQSLLNATAPYAQLSDFNQLLSSFPDIAASLLTNFSSILTRQTILVPSNGAFDNYRQQMGSNISSLSSSDIGNILNYHTLQGALSSSDIQQPGGLISSTALTNPTYANREVLDSGGQPPQVVYISTSDTSAGTKVKVRVRQVNALGSVGVESGAGSEIELEPTPGNWSGGVFYVVNGSNAAKGLTCVCPNNEAFASMGDLAHSNGNLTDGPGSLLATVTRHGLTGSFYTTNFTDGDLIHSQNGYPILVTRRNGSIFLNDAQMVGTNFIANTGCVHALDRIMGFLNTTTNITTPANASIYSNTSNIPSPTPVAMLSTASGGAIPTTSTAGNLLDSPDTAAASTAVSTAASSTSPSAGPPTRSPSGAGAPQASATGTSDATAMLAQQFGPLLFLASVVLTAFMFL
ncbi:MAG: hypothetical protein Q9218_004685 [Villophora microphyllina]